MQARKCCAVSPTSWWSAHHESTVIEQTITIKNRTGLHTRPAATLVKTASRFAAEFMIEKDSVEINGKSIIGVMTLAAEQGSQLTLRFNGPDEQEAAAAIVELFERGFDER
jgi:phosphocarrier protein HPr